jgi:hypothetical protein
LKASHGRGVEVDWMNLPAFMLDAGLLIWDRGLDSTDRKRGCLLAPITPRQPIDRMNQNPD